MTSVHTTSINAGDYGAAQTASSMVRLIREGAVHPAVRRLALRIVAGTDGRDQRDQAGLLKTWMHGHFRFVRDPHGAELLHTPEYLLREVGAQGYVQGDCDDAAILGGALARSIGFRTRLIIVSFHDRRAPFSHVWVEIGDVAGKWWYELDVTRSRPDLEAHVARRKVIPV